MAQKKSPTKKQNIKTTKKEEQIKTKKLSEEELKVQAEELEMLEELNLNEKISEAVQQKESIVNVDEEVTDVKIETKEEIPDESFEFVKEQHTDEEEEEDLKDGEKEYENAPKMTLNELRTIKRHENEKEKRQKEEETNVEDIIVDEDEKEIKEEKEKKSNLSLPALQWKKWFEYKNIKAKDFLEKYPHHKMREVFEELIKNGY